MYEQGSKHQLDIPNNLFSILNETGNPLNVQVLEKKYVFDSYKKNLQKFSFFFKRSSIRGVMDKNT